MPNPPVANQTDRLPSFLTNTAAAIARTASLGWRRSVQVIKKPLSFVQRVLVAPIQRRFSAVKWIKESHLRIAAKVSKATARLRSLVRRKPSAQALKITRLLEDLVAFMTVTLATQEEELAQKKFDIAENEQELRRLQRQLSKQEALQSEQQKALDQQLITDRIQNLAKEVGDLQKALKKSTTEKKALEKSIRDITGATARLRSLVRCKPSAQDLKMARLEDLVAFMTVTLATQEEELAQKKFDIAENEQELRRLQRQLSKQEALQSEQQKALDQQLITDRIQNLAEEVGDLQKALKKSTTEKKALEKSIRDITEFIKST